MPVLENLFWGRHNPDTWQMRNATPAYFLRSRPRATKTSTAARK